MASYTTNYNLKKPADVDSYDISDANGNMDIIDGALNTLNSKFTDLLVTDTIQVPSPGINISGGSYASSQILAIPAKTGYKVVSAIPADPGNIRCVINAISFNTGKTNIIFSVLNTSTSAFSGIKPSFIVIYVKT